jgi:hypothetical protein
MHSRGRRIARQVLGLFPRASEIDGVFYKLLTANDDSGRHGILIPLEHYQFFPPLVGGERNPSAPVSTLWTSGDTWRPAESRFVQYDRYPERRLTALSPDEVNVDAQVRLFLAARYQGTATYACRVLTPRDGAAYLAAIQELNIPSAARIAGGAVGVIDGVQLRGQAGAEFDDLLSRLQAIANAGPVRSLRGGDTGVGYTLETLLGIHANVVQGGGDYRGIEIKATRSRWPIERRPKSNEHVTLFAKTPEWGMLGDRVGLLDAHGYTDPNGRFGLYMSIFAGAPNSLGWSLDPDDGSRLLSAECRGQRQVWWNYTELERRVVEKHTESAFVTAHAIQFPEGEAYQFDHVLHCRDATLENLLGLIRERGAFVDFAMHRLPAGGVRDHGFLFRTSKAYLPRLFRTVESFRLA